MVILAKKIFHVRGCTENGAKNEIGERILCVI